MSILKNWANAHGSTEPEIMTLLMTESPDNWTATVNAINNGPDPIPGGRDTALSILLERGRSGSIKASVSSICYAMGKDCTPENVLEAIRESGCGDAVADGPGTEPSASSLFACDRLPALIGWMTGAPGPEPADGPVKANKTAAAIARIMNAKADGDPAPVPVPSDEPDPPARKPAKPAPKRKTKYSVTKAMASSIFGAPEQDDSPGSDPVPIRTIRMFLLSLPDYKAQDIAVMSDPEAADLFRKDYTVMPTKSGILVMSADCQTKLVETLATAGAYFVPNGDPV